MSKSSPTPSHIPIDSAATPLGRGAIIGRYLILGLVGRGGMGEVYAAYDPELDRKVAVKLLRVKAGNGVSLAERRQRTLREAQAIARLSHPNVVVAYDGQVRVMDFGLARQMDKPGIKGHRGRVASPAPRRFDGEVGTGTLPLDHQAIPIDQG